MGLIRVSLMTNEVGFFPLPIDRSHVFFGGMSNRIFCPFLKSWAFLSLLLPVLLSLEESLHTSDTSKSLFRRAIGQHFLPICELSFHFCDDVVRSSSPIFDEVQCINFC